jgi:hypothetical protein
MVVEHDDWKAKDDVFAAVEEKVDRIVEFRQDEYQQVREMVRKKLEAEKIKVENTEVVSQEQLVDGTDAKSSINGSAEKQAAEDAAQVASAEHLSNANEEAKSPIIVDGDPMIRTVDSKKLMSEHGTTSHISHGGTSRSHKSKMMARVSEITESQKKQKWEEMLSQYYGEGMQQFNLMRHLRINVSK